MSSLESLAESRIKSYRQGEKGGERRMGKESSREVMKVVGLAAPKGLANCRDWLISVSTGKLGRS